MVKIRTKKTVKKLDFFPQFVPKANSKTRQYVARNRLSCESAINLMN